MSLYGWTCVVRKISSLIILHVATTAVYHQKLHWSLYKQQDSISIDSHKTLMVSEHCLNVVVRVFLIMTVKLDFIDWGTKLLCSLEFFQNFCVTFVYGTGTWNIVAIRGIVSSSYSGRQLLNMYQLLAFGTNQQRYKLLFRNLLLLRQHNHCTQYMTLRLRHWIWNLLWI